MKVLVTGAAGFIGSKLMYMLADRGDEVVGIDNLNDYYDVRLKHGRIAEFCTGERKRFIEMDIASAAPTSRARSTTTTKSSSAGTTSLPTVPRPTPWSSNLTTP